MSGAGERIGGNGHVPDPEADVEAALDDLDAQPLDADEAAAGAAAAADDVDESLDERVEAVLDELEGVSRGTEGESVVYAVGGRPFATLRPDALEAWLDANVLKAALRTPDASPSPRGPGWVTFTPVTIDRYALDRAEAWVRLAHRRASGR